MPPIDPRSLIQMISFEDQANVNQVAGFTRSTTWLQNVTWLDAPLIVTPAATKTAVIAAPNAADYQSLQDAIAWNSTHAMTPLSTKLPKAVEKIFFLKAGGQFINQIYLDWNIGVTSTDVQFSFRDNSVTSGDFTNSATGTIPVFAFPNTSTYGGIGRLLQVSLLARGRYMVGMRIVDNSGNWSLYDMQWIVL